MKNKPTRKIVFWIVLAAAGLLLMLGGTVIIPTSDVVMGQEPPHAPTPTPTVEAVFTFSRGTTGEMHIEAQQGIYKLPWDVTQNSWWRVRNPPAWHSGNCLDFQPSFHSNSGIDAWVLAAADGTVSSICRGSLTANVVINHADGEIGYAHLDVTSLRVSENDVVVQGQWLGNLYQPNPPGGSFSDGCGSGLGRHIHFCLPYRDLVIDGQSGEYYANLPFQASVNSSNQRRGACCCTLGALASCKTTKTNGTEIDNLLPVTVLVNLDAAPNSNATLAPISISSTGSSPTPSPTPSPTSASFELRSTELQRTPPASASYCIARSVFGSGGSPRASAHYVMQGTTGQTTGVAWRQSSSYVLRSGYWGRIGTTHDMPYDAYLPIILKQH